MAHLGFKVKAPGTWPRLGYVIMVGSQKLWVGHIEHVTKLGKTLLCTICIYIYHYGNLIYVP